MKNRLLSMVITILFLLLSRSAFSTVSITDSNSINQIRQGIEKLPSGSSMNLTFKSKIDNSLQPMLIKMPENYTSKKPWPLLVVLHGMGDGPIVVPPINSMVQIGPFGRGDLRYRGLGEKDVFECIELAKQIFTIDPDRIYLCGFSMGGDGTFYLGLKYPDIWAACAPVCGRMTNLEKVTNANNLAFWIHTGSKDMLVPPKYSKNAYEKAIELGFKDWKYSEYDDMGHSFWVDWDKIEQWFLLHTRTHNPPTIRFTSEDPARSYWAEITQKRTESDPARIDVQVDSQTIVITTSNTANYILHLKEAPVKLSDTISIIENGHKIFDGHSDGIFNRGLDGSKIKSICTQ